MRVAGHRIEGIGLGTAQFAFRDGTPEDSVATVRAALDAGVRLIDTALAYTRAGVESYAEQIVARALRGIVRDRPLVATKGGHWREGDTFPVDGRPETLRAHCEISLRTLGVDQIDLYQLHHVDPAAGSNPAGRASSMLYFGFLFTCLEAKQGANGVRWGHDPNHRQAPRAW